MLSLKAHLCSWEEAFLLVVELQLDRDGVDHRVLLLHPVLLPVHPSLAVAAGGLHAGVGAAVQTAQLLLVQAQRLEYMLMIKKMRMMIMTMMMIEMMIMTMMMIEMMIWMMMIEVILMMIMMIMIMLMTMMMMMMVMWIEMMTIEKMMIEMITIKIMINMIIETIKMNNGDSFERPSNRGFLSERLNSRFSQ